MVERENGYPEEKYAIIIMDTFKDQDNGRLIELCSENYCEVVIVPHNLTNKLQPLDITVNKTENKRPLSRTCITGGFQMNSQHSEIELSTPLK